MVNARRLVGPKKIFQAQKINKQIPGLLTRKIKRWKYTEKSWEALESLASFLHGALKKLEIPKKIIHEQKKVHKKISSPKPCKSFDSHC